MEIVASSWRLGVEQYALISRMRAVNQIISYGLPSLRGPDPVVLTGSLRLSYIARPRPGCRRALGPVLAFRWVRSRSSPTSCHPAARMGACRHPDAESELIRGLPRRSTRA